ncbi:MAG: S-methyl-5-thioribose-1-phosphate isomerase [Candidatus Marinimicrobia bacterium]|nr:S-methyl-5-thioribose-1-phosphate isomerase [Candidatus Neomarinimicrobiota bacterium]
MMIKPLFWENDRLFIVDQTLLPVEYKRIEIKNHLDMAGAIKRLVIRGAPAIGIAAAAGLIVGLKPFINSTSGLFFEKLNEISILLNGTRPTAVNLSWALNRMKTVAESMKNQPVPDIWDRLYREALAIHREDIEMCQAIGRHGQSIIPEKANILTHCNTGGLATGGLGTALGVIITAQQLGKDIHVYVDETRPLLQGARLTAWELSEEKVPHTLICDNMAAYIMSTRKIDAVIVGADRIAANGDAANKIGTYGLAVLANYHNVPFYMAAPSSTIDPNIQSGQQIIIEERNGNEVRNVFGTQIAPFTSPAISPAFDVTTNELICGIITEKGVFRKPYYFS